MTDEPKVPPAPLDQQHWIVVKYSKETGKPKKRSGGNFFCHASEEDATAEADRLSKTYPGTVFAVYCWVGLAETVFVKTP